MRTRSKQTSRAHSEVQALAAAENLWKRGHHDGAWPKIEALEPIDRVMPDVIDVRLRICTSVEVDNKLSPDSVPGIEKWEAAT